MTNAIHVYESDQVVKLFLESGQCYQSIHVYESDQVVKLFLESGQCYQSITCI